MHKFFTKNLYLILLTLLTVGTARAQQLLDHNFSYTGNLTSNGWTAHSVGGTNPIATTAGLIYTGLQGSGVDNAALVGNAGGEDDNIGFTTQSSDGDLFFSCLVNVTDAAATKSGDYFIHFLTGTSSFSARVYGRITASGVNFGVNNASTAVYGSTNFSKNTTYLLIVKYTISNAGNDAVSVWVIPSGVPATEALAGTPEYATNASAGQNSIAAIALRQGSNTASVQTVVDAIKVGTTWASVTPATSTGPTLFSTSGLSNFSTIAGTASAEQFFELSGTNLTGAPGNITVTASANVEVSLTSGGPFSSSINVPYTSATLATTNIYTRLAATAPAGSFAGTVTNSGGGATSTVVNISGNVLVSEPGLQATNVIISNISDNGFDVNWTNGDGSSRLVTVRETTTAAVPPTDGIEYVFPGNTGTGNRIIYLGNGAGPVSVTGLNAGTNYTVQAFEFNGSAGSNNYNITTATGNPATTTTTGIGSFLQQGSYFTSVAVPRYGISGTNNRMPVMYFANVNGLQPNTTYRYYTQAAAFTDLGSNIGGAGNSLLIDYTVSPVTYTYAASLSVVNAGGYGKFTTNASGSFRGALGFVNTSNARFDANNIVYPSISIAEDGPAPVVQYRFALNEGITVLAPGVTSSTGSYIKGASSATAGNIVGLWDNVDGNLVAARPLSMTLVEHPVIGGDAWGTAATNFITGYDQTTGSWNTIIPNSSVNGVRLIQQFDINTAEVLGCNSDADGTWPGGAVTANANSGATPIVIAQTDAPLNGGSCYSILPVQLKSFAIQKAGNSTRLNWSTAQEINSREFVVERSTNGSTWISIATLAAAGNSVVEKNYSYVDNTPVKGLNFYRIRLVDVDNAFSNTDTKSVLFGTADVVVITPNPTSSFVNIYMSKNDNSQSQVFITTANGRLVETIRTNEQVYRYNTSRLNKGVYIFRVMSNGNSSSQKVIIQ